MQSDFVYLHAKANKVSKDSLYLYKKNITEKRIDCDTDTHGNLQKYYKCFLLLYLKNNVCDNLMINHCRNIANIYFF